MEISGIGDRTYFHDGKPLPLQLLSQFQVFRLGSDGAIVNCWEVP